LGATTFNGDPSNYRTLLRQLKPGDTLSLAPGKYAPLHLVNLNGTPDAWITVTGPASEPLAIIQGEPGANTIEIEQCSYLSIESLLIDSRGIPGAFGISARGHEQNFTHDIRIDGNTLIGQGGGQQTDGISTKTPTWGWVIRYNKIIGAGTGIYLGDSDGTQPFVAGVIENNLIRDTIGYNMEIKNQVSIPDVPGMPLGPTSTIIRNNVFIKDDRPSPDGDRPNLLVGGFPDSGPGSLNTYEIYGNYFVHNSREALFQGSGRLSLHDNIFVDGPHTYPAIVLTNQGRPLKVGMVYSNTIYTSGPGVRVKNAADTAVIGNLIFSSLALSGLIVGVADNITGTPQMASLYVRMPSFDVSAADFYPLPGMCWGKPIDLTLVRTDKDYALDFNGAPKTAAKGAVVFRGAYAGEDANPGWHLAAGLKAPNTPNRPAPMLVWVTPAIIRPGTQARITITGANFGSDAVVSVSGTGLQVKQATIDDATQITANLVTDPSVAPGVREITVKTSTGVSNGFKLSVSPGRGRQH